MSNQRFCCCSSAVIWIVGNPCAGGDPPIPAPVVRRDWLIDNACFAEDSVVVKFDGVCYFFSLLTSDQVQAKALTTVLFVIGAVGLQTVLGFGLAYLVHRQKRGGGLLTVVFLIPMMLSPVIVGAFWRLMLDSSFGVVNGTLSMLGVDGPQWLSQQGVALLSLIFVDTWQWTPFIMVIALAGLNAVPSYLYEAADIDQASDWFKFKSITLPIVWPILLIAILFRVIDAFRLFDIVLIVTGGGPGGTTETLSFHIYKLAIRNFQTGLASAYGVLMLIVVNIMAVIFIKYLERLQSK